MNKTSKNIVIGLWLSTIGMTAYNGAQSYSNLAKIDKNCKELAEYIEGIDGENSKIESIALCEQAKNAQKVNIVYAGIVEICALSLLYYTASKKYKD